MQTYLACIYTPTDLPTIVCGNRLAYLDPHEEIWPRETGQWYDIDKNVHYSDMFAPFEKLCGFTVRNAYYNGTLFRFPLRDVRRDKRVSSHTYDINKLRELLTALREEAKCILLFLRSVRSVEVFEISESGKHFNILKVSISETSIDRLAQKRSDFQVNLQRLFQAHSFGIRESLTQFVRVQVDITDSQKGTTGSSKWLVANQVGSQSDEVRKIAKELKAFPWVGVALETSAADIAKSGGRVFCVLPMPLEVSCSLPVHVNGTFSLNDERRELKWRTIERKNDLSAQWNHLLVEQLLPPCYASLLLNHAKMLLEPEQFCKAWPDTEKVARTQWAGLLNPLLRTLFSKDVIPFCRPGGSYRYITVSSATFVPRRTVIPQVVITALVACGVKIVTVTDAVWNALTHCNIGVTCVSPSLTRNELRKSTQSYNNMTSPQKLALLQYCLSDNSYGDLNNLVLLPLANGSFGMFGTAFSSTVYLCSQQCPHYLLPNLGGELVNENIDSQLYAKLKIIADGRFSNLSLLTVDSVAMLLQRAMQALQYQNTVTLPWSNFTMQWLEKFWYWVSGGNLRKFSNQLIVPISDGSVTRLTKASACLFIPSTQVCSQSLISALDKLGVQCCQQKMHPFVRHNSYLASLMNFFSADGTLDAIQQASPSYNYITLTSSEATDLMTHVHSANVNWQRKATLRELPMFITLNNTGEKLYSVSQVERSSGVAQMEPPSFPLNSHNIPSSVILFLTSNYYQRLLLQKLSVNSTTTIDLLMNTLFQLIESESIKRNAAKSLMKEVLQNFHVITSNVSHQKKEQFQSAIARLPFLPVSVGRPKPPNTLFSPSDSELKTLFFEEPVFPLEPFSGGQYLKVLKQCGLKTRVSPQDIVDIICSISLPASASPVAVDKVKQTRAKAVLTYIRTSGLQLSETVHISDYMYRQMLTFLQGLRKLSETKSWLPVQATRPNNYIPCLTWKGSEYTGHLVSFGSSVLLSENQDSLALACGSQMYFVEHSLPRAVCIEFTPAPDDMVKHIMAHLEEVIVKHTEVPDVRKITLGIYRLLHKYQRDGCSVDLSLMEKTNDCVWLTRPNKFIHPNSISLEQNQTFQQNLEPFIYILPDDLTEFESLFVELGVREVVTTSQIMGILEKIEGGNSHSLEISNKQAWNLVMAILRWLGESDDDGDDIDYDAILVPVESDTEWPTVITAKDVVYTDSAFLQRFIESSDGSEDEYTFVHHRVSSKLARQLRLTPLSKHLNISEDAFEDVGQSEPLTVRLKNILKDYKDGLTIIKELLQNADDAGATEMNICYDTRHHCDRRESLFFPGMAECHGPALVVNNDAMFTKEDFENITKLAGATKEGKTLKIGKFGIGFCSVYHITDIPSFVSNDLLYIFDPTLTYLKDEVKNPARPGKKVHFASPFITRSKQLAPYASLYGFDPQSKYEGTTFRFPFRKATSELSGKVYGTDDVRQLMEQMQNSSSKLILFLQSIETVTFSQIDSGQELPVEKMKITKSEQTLAGNRCIYQVTFSVSGSADTSECWLFETCTQTILQKYSTASVACLLSPIPDEELYQPKPVKGEMFCFLPLSMNTGLPVHVSSNFAVSNNRRGIWTSDDSDSGRSEEVEWNEALMNGVIASSYCKLLEALKELQVECKLKDYDFYSMWPVKGELTIQNPWNLNVDAVYKSVERSELLFSNSTDRWLALEESKFLHPDILRVSHSATSIPDAVLDVENHLKLPVVHLPPKYHEHLDISQSTETEEAFLEHFFTSINELEDIQDSRNAVLLLSLECYANELNRQDESRFCYLQGLLQENACIPCEPDGLLLKTPNELIHPKANFAKLFDIDDNVFPLNEFCDKVLVDKAMKELGMLHDSLPLERLEERATTIEELYEEDKTKALERVKVIIECLLKEDKRENCSSESCLKISEIPFLPVMDKPENYPLPWKGDSDKLYSAMDILLKGTNIYGDDSNIYLAGSQCIFLNQDDPSKGGCGFITHRVKELLKIRSSPTYTEVISHFHTLVDDFNESEQMVTWADRTARKVYEYFENLLKQAEDSESFDITLLSEKQCIWTEKMFVETSAVAIDWSKDGPYLFKVPNSMVHRKRLQKALDIKKKFSDDDLVGALQYLKRDNGDRPLSNDGKMLVRDILSEIASRQKLQTDITPIMLPDNNFIMHEANKLYYNDMPWQPQDDSYRFVHDIVPLATAKSLGVQLCRSASLARYSVTGSGFSIEEFGQHEELTRRIQSIIRDYPFDMTILKELLQNADDAKATKMHVILDMREHSKEHILSEEWGDLQGPALLVWNDSVFTNDDLKGIQRLGLGSKRSDSETIGQYGIGFNAVYHLTDCPSFLTGGDTLCILDPHMRYVPQATIRHPGVRYANLDETFWSSFDGMKSTYLRDSVKSMPKELQKGTLFRFPLRHTLHHVKSSDIVRDIDQSKQNSSRVISGQKMYELVKKWAPNMKQSLLFLNNVIELKFFVIRDGRGVLCLENSYRTELDDCAVKNRLELTDKIKLFNDEKTREPYITTYPLTIVESIMERGIDRKEEWLIQQGIGDVQKVVKKWSYVEQVKPRHGIAAPLKHKSTTLRGQVFCFLPLPLYSGLPVHINGHFILNSTRRNLWVATDKEGDDKSRWNQNILQAIASSYAQFLERMPEYFAQFEGFTSRKTIETTVIEYYKCFPCKKHKDETLSGPWLNLADQVFQIMSERNSPVLAVPTNASSKSSEDKYLLQWQPLKCEQMQASQVYFWRENNKEMKSILERIGMKITCAPLWIMNQFKDVKCELPIISRASVYEFYISFNKQFISSHYPCDIQETPFKSVENFKSFTEFLLESQPMPITFELDKGFPKQPFGHPLLLNACNQLCIFNQANKVFCSKYMQLFPKCSERFLHRNLIDCGYCSSYFISVSDDKSTCTQAVKVVLETILPAELKNSYVSFQSEAIKQLDVKALWKCFKHDTVFKLVVDEVLKVWALLLTKNHKLFRCSSSEQLLPIIPESPGTPAVMSVIEQDLKGPVLDIEVVPVEVVETLCPQPSEPIKMLKNLYYLHREFPFSEVMNVQIASVLLSYFGTIHLKNESQCYKYLKSLPLFETMDGNITVLEGKRVYIWPNNIGQDGNEKWIEGTDLVFLKRWGTWTHLGVDTELGIQKTTAEQTYIQFIFPKFFKLNKKERYNHMRYIRDHLFDANYAIQKNNYPARQFILGLQNLPCIGDEGHSLDPVSSFYTDQKKIFETFPEHFKLIPEDVYRGDKRTWMSFFQKIGLQGTVTRAVFVTLCNDVARGKLKEATKVSSKVLLEYLFSEEEAKHNGFHSNRQFLTQISGIAFVCPVPMPELEWIHKVPQTTNRVITSNEEVPLCKLSGSCINLYKDMVWVVKHITEVSGLEEKSVLKDLEICTELTANDVIENVKCLAQTCFADHQLFTKYTAPLSKPGQKKIMDVMVKIFEHLQQLKVGGSDLKALPCIPVHALYAKEGSQYPVLVKPHCVVFRPLKETQIFFPFIHNAKDLLYRAKQFLETLGVKNSIELNHMQIVLQSAFEYSDSIELDLNTKRVVRSAVKEIMSLLEKNEKERGKMGEETITEMLSPLYLSGTDKRMHPVNSLVYTSRYKHNYKLEGTNLFLVWTPENISTTNFCQLLPQAIRPRPLSQLCIKRVSDSCKKCENKPDIAHELERTLNLPTLPQAMCKVVEFYTKGSPQEKERILEVFTQTLTNFFDTIEICCVENLLIDVFLKDSTIHTPVASEVQNCFLLHEKDFYQLYIDSKIGPFSFYTVQECVINELLSPLRGVSALEKRDKLKDDFKCLLMAKSQDELYGMLQEKNINIGELHHMIDHEHEPRVGETVPESLHFRLDLSNQNIFQPEEWVAYQPTDEERYIYAEVKHVVNLKDSLGEPLKPMHMQYIILTSKDDTEGKMVEATELSKFIKGEKAPEDTHTVESESQELVLFQGDPNDAVPPPPQATSSAEAGPVHTPKPIDIEQAKQEVRQELEDIWKLQNENRKKALHRLYLRWHPDKNPHDPQSAEEVFKFIQQEMDRLERGEGVCTSNTHSWRQYERAWNNTARQHQYYQNQYQQDTTGTAGSSHRGRRNRGGGGGGGGGFFNTSFTPQTDNNEAKRWVRQAAADYEVLKNALVVAHINGNLSYNVCFMAHEVAEKALKGAMYAKCGLREKQRHNHNITPLGRAIEQIEPDKASGLSALTLPLEPTYYEETRFPKQGYPSSVPYEEFSLANAEEAEKCADGILKIVKSIVNIEEV